MAVSLHRSRFLVFVALLLCETHGRSWALRGEQHLGPEDAAELARAQLLAALGDPQVPMSFAALRGAGQPLYVRFSFCVLFTLFAAPCGACALAALYGVKGHRDSLERLDTGEVDITSGRVFDKGCSASFSGAELYHLSFRFEALRGDGRRYRMNVENRQHSKLVWQSLAEGDGVRVAYLQEDPSICKLYLDKDDEAEPRSLPLGVLVATVVVGVVALRLLMNAMWCGLMTGGLEYGVGCAVIWTVVACCCFGACCRPLLLRYDPLKQDVSVEELTGGERKDDDDSPREPLQPKRRAPSPRSAARKEATDKRALRERSPLPEGKMRLCATGAEELTGAEFKNDSPQAPLQPKRRAPSPRSAALKEATDKRAFHERSQSPEGKSPQCATATAPGAASARTAVPSTSRTEQMMPSTSRTEQTMPSTSRKEQQEGSEAPVSARSQVPPIVGLPSPGRLPTPGAQRGRPESPKKTPFAAPAVVEPEAALEAAPARGPPSKERLRKERHAESARRHAAEQQAEAQWKESRARRGAEERERAAPEGPSREAASAEEGAAAAAEEQKRRDAETQEREARQRGNEERKARETQKRRDAEREAKAAAEQAKRGAQSPRSAVAEEQDAQWRARVEREGEEVARLKALSPRAAEREPGKARPEGTPCPTCKGSGRIKAIPCDWCDGTGVQGRPKAARKPKKWPATANETLKTLMQRFPEREEQEIVDALARSNFHAGRAVAIIRNPSSRLAGVGALGL